MTKIIIAAGGKGTRIHELTGSIIPKSLCRISSKIPKTLISYQLQKIYETGFKDVLILFETDWQIQLFRQLIKIKEVPDLNYKITTMSWGHSMNGFKDEQVIDFIGGDNFVFSYGDLYYSSETLIEMNELMTKNNTSVASIMHSESDRWKVLDKKITFTIDSTGKIKDIIRTENSGFTLHAPFFYQNRALISILEELNETSRTLPLIERLISKDQLSGFEPKFLLNMNNPEDITRMEKGILDNHDK